MVGFRGTAVLAMELKNEVRRSACLGDGNAYVGLAPRVTVVAASPLGVETGVVVTPQVAIGGSGAICHSPPHEFALRAHGIVDIELNR